MDPTLIVGQAVIKLNQENITWKDIDRLEKKLEVQRTLTPRGSSTGLIGQVKARRIGKFATYYDKRNKEYLDQGTFSKLEATKTEYKRHTKQTSASDQDLKGTQLIKKIDPERKYEFPLEIDEIAKKDNKNWIAIVHADGNSLGHRLRTFIEQNQEKANQKLKDFSENLGNATQKAFQIAFEEIIVKKEQYSTIAVGTEEKEKKLVPLRPILLGGDDVTFIIRADLAIDFTRVFLAAFEEQTKKILSQGLTACAGIAFIKAKFPFHYGVNLADELCRHAKKVAKKINGKNVPSCMMFHRLQDSFAESYEDIMERELVIKNSRCVTVVEFDFGPYAIHENATPLPHINALLEKVNKLNEEGAPAGKIRNWLAEISINADHAEQLLSRIRQVNRSYVDSLGLSDDAWKDADCKSHIYDMMSLYAIGTKSSS